MESENFLDSCLTPLLNIPWLPWKIFFSLDYSLPSPLPNITGNKISQVHLHFVLFETASILGLFALGLFARLIASLREGKFE